MRSPAPALLLLVAGGLAAAAQDARTHDVLLRGTEPPVPQALPGSAPHALPGSSPGSLPAEFLMPPASKTPAVKTMPETLSDAIGTWDLSLDGTSRRCELSLSGESGPNGRLLRFPAGCRRALPVLARAAGWLFSGKGIRIVDANILPLIELSPRPDGGSMQGATMGGEHYSLVPLQTMLMLPPSDLPEMPSAPHGAVAGLSDAHPIPGSQPVLRADVLTRPDGGRGARPVEPEGASAAGPPPGKLGERPAPGTYALDRFGDKDVCRIALDSRPAGPARAGERTGERAGEPARDNARDLAPARILPGCRDSGIAVFDPVSWRFASGHLTLKAKRGHAVNLVATGDGRWRRDPDIGTTFVLRRVE